MRNPTRGLADEPHCNGDGEPKWKTGDEPTRTRRSRYAVLPKTDVCSRFSAVGDQRILNQGWGSETKVVPPPAFRVGLSDGRKTSWGRGCDLEIKIQRSDTICALDHGVVRVRKVRRIRKILHQLVPRVGQVPHVKVGRVHKRWVVELGDERERSF